MNIYSIRKILVPVDLSDTSINALNSAVALAKEHQASIRILNISEPSYSRDINGSLVQYSANATSDVLAALASAVEHAGDIQPKLTQLTGHVVESIITTSLAEQCDLIVMGTHGASGYREGYIGTNTYNVIKYSACPVLTIPPKRRPSPFGKILFPVRPTTGSLMRYDIIGNFLLGSAKVDLLGLSYLRMERDMGVMHKIAREMRDYLPDSKVKVNVSWGKGISIADDILQYAQQTSPELIVLSSVLDASAKTEFIGPQLQRIIHCSKVPIVSMKHIGVPLVV